MSFLKQFIAISIFYLGLAIAVYTPSPGPTIPPLAICNRLFVENTLPGYYYRIYPIPLNGVPYGMPATNTTDWVSRLGFMGMPLYSGNVPDISFNQYFTSTPGDVQYGEVFGNNITTTNFTMSGSAWFIPAETGWFNIFLVTQSAGELMIVNSTSAYCCVNATDNRVDQQFILTSDNNTVSGYVYLYQGLHYQLTTSFVNQNGNAYYYTYMITPSGAYDGINNYVRQMNAGDPNEVVTCDYDVGWYTTTMPYGGTVTTTAHQELYKILASNRVTLQEWELIGIPSALYTPPATSTTISSSSTSSSSGSSSSNSNSVSSGSISYSSSSVEIFSSSTYSSVLSSPVTSYVSSSNDQSLETSTSVFTSYNGTVSVGLFNGSYVLTSYTEPKSSSSSMGSSLSAINGDFTISRLANSSSTDEGVPSSSNIIISQSGMASASLVRNMQSAIENDSSSAISVYSYVSSVCSYLYSSSGPIFNNISESSLSSSGKEAFSGTTPVVSSSSVLSTTVIQESASSFGASGVAPGYMSSVTPDHLNPTITSFTGTSRIVVVSVPISMPEFGNEQTIITVITTTVVETDGYDCRGYISLIGFPDDSKNVVKRTITTTITSIMCPRCMETAADAEQGGVAAHQQNPVASNNVANVQTAASTIIAGSNPEQVIPQVSQAVKPTSVLPTFSANPNEQPHLDMNFSAIVAIIFSAFVLFL